MTIDQKTLRTFLWGIAGIVVLYWALQNPDVLGGWVHQLLAVTFPLILGFCMAFVLNVPMRMLESRVFKKQNNPKIDRLRRPVCMVLAMALVVLVVVFVVRMVVPEIVNTFVMLGATIPTFLNEAFEFATKNDAYLPGISEWIATLQIDWKSTGEALLGFVTNGATDLLGSTISMLSTVFGGLINFFFALFFAIYILLGKETLKRQLSKLCKAVFPAEVCEKIIMVTHLSNRIFSSFVAGQCVEACILGTLCWLGMTLFRLPYAPMIGSLVGLTALIPIVGGFIGTFVGAFLILMVSPVKALTFVIFLLVLQQIEGNVIYPRVVGSSVGLPPIWCLAAIAIGSGLAGIIGILFAVPVASVLYTLTRNYVRKRNAPPQDAV